MSFLLGGFGFFCERHDHRVQMEMPLCVGFSVSSKDWKSPAMLSWNLIGEHNPFDHMLKMLWAINSTKSRFLFPRETSACRYSHPMNEYRWKLDESRFLDGGHRSLVLSIWYWFCEIQPKFNPGKLVLWDTAQIRSRTLTRLPLKPDF